MGGTFSSGGGTPFSARHYSPAVLEEIEELRVMTGMDTRTLAELHKDFLAAAATDSLARAGGKAAAAAASSSSSSSPPAPAAEPLLTLSGFYLIPFVAHCPLREQLAVLYGYVNEDDALPFRRFAIASAPFAPTATRDARVAAMFRLYDADGDGKISRDDLLYVLSMTVAFEGDDAEAEAAAAAAAAAAATAGAVTPAASSSASPGRRAAPKPSRLLEIVKGQADVDPLMLTGGDVASAARRSAREDKLLDTVERTFLEASTHPERSYISLHDFARATRQVEGFTHRGLVVVGGL
jgi:hypothetical protein